MTQTSRFVFPWTFEVTAAHNVIGDEDRLETFEGVSDILSPASTETTRLEFADEREPQTIKGAKIIKITTSK